MNIDTNNNVLHAEVTFYNHDIATCGKLRAFVTYWSDTDVRLTVGDQDDLDIAVVYAAKSVKEARKICHELINYLNDIERQYVHTDILFGRTKNNKELTDFFPDLGCARHWE